MQEQWYRGTKILQKACGDMLYCPICNQIMYEQEIEHAQVDGQIVKHYICDNHFCKVVEREDTYYVTENTRVSIREVYR
jgi:hypothetical protein